MRALIPLLLAATAPLAAQDRDLLPMAFVRVDSAVGRRLAADWRQLETRGVEWAYCVTGWTFAFSQDRDTVFVITGVEPVTASARAHEVTRFSCSGRHGEAQPMVHAHPGGDCSASRADAANALALNVPFGLVQCGPRSTAGYTLRQFVLMMRGVWFDRSHGMR